MTTTRIDNGGPAFPRPASEYTANGTLHDGNDAEQAQDGMTLRDYFAAKAMAAMLQVMKFNPLEQHAPGGLPTVGEVIAERAYYAADAMLAQRNRK